MKRIQVFFIFLILFTMVLLAACQNKEVQLQTSTTQEISKTTETQRDDEIITERTLKNDNIIDTTENKNENIICEKPILASLKTFPRLAINIVEGPVILEDSSLCYYRINAKVSANPKAMPAFSKDDSFGAWGTETVQINLLPEETYNLKITASNEIGKTSAEVELGWQGAEIINNSTVITKDENNPVFYGINVSEDEQKVKIYYKDKLLKELVCSTGAPETPTPKGSFKTTDKIFYSWLPKYDVGAYYFVRFFNSYLFHSVPFDDEGRMIKKELDNLGIASSHGCVRLGIEDAKWFYETLPSGIKVEIQ